MSSLLQNKKKQKKSNSCRGEALLRVYVCVSTTPFPVTKGTCYIGVPSSLRCKECHGHQRVEKKNIYRVSILVQYFNGRNKTSYAHSQDFLLLLFTSFETQLNFFQTGNI